MGLSMTGQTNVRAADCGCTLAARRAPLMSICAAAEETLSIPIAALAATLIPNADHSSITPSRRRNLSFVVVSLTKVFLGLGPTGESESGLLHKVKLRYNLESFLKNKVPGCNLEHFLS